MILVDSCVWIDHLRGNSSPATAFLDRMIERADVELCVSGVVIFEVLRGISHPDERKRVAGIFSKLERRDYQHGSVDQMLRHDLECRRRGFTLSKLGDWLIIQTALDHDLELLTTDKDFRRVSPHVPLRLLPF